MTTRGIRIALACMAASAVLAGCGSSNSDSRKAREALREPVPGVIEIFLRTSSGLPNYPDAPVASDVLSGTNPATSLVVGVPFVVIVKATPGNPFIDTNLDAHRDPDIDVTMPQHGEDRGGGNEDNLSIRFDLQLGPSSNLPGTGGVPFNTLPAFDGTNERAIIDRARQVGIPFADIALPANFDLAVLLNRNILTSTEFGLASPDGRDQDTRVLLGWAPSASQLIQASATGTDANVDASVLFTESPLGVSSASIPVIGAAGPSLSLRVRSGSSLVSTADAPAASAVRADTMEISSLAAGLAYVLEIEIVPGSAGLDLHTDPEWMSDSPPQSGLARGGGHEATVALTANRDLGPPENLPGTGLPPYSALPAFNGSNERAIVQTAIAASIDPYSIALPAGFNLAVLLNRNILTSDFSGQPSLDSRNPLVVPLTALQSGIGAAPTASLAGDTVTYTATVVDRAGLMASDIAILGVTAPVPPVIDLVMRTQSSRPNYDDAPVARDVQVETMPITSIGAEAPFEIQLGVTPGSAGIDLHFDPDFMVSTPPQSGLARGGGNEARISIVADRQLGGAATLPGAGAPPYDSLPFFSGANERAIVDSAIAAGIDPGTIALPAGFDIAVLLNRNVLTSDPAGAPSPDTRNPATIFLAGVHVGTLQAPAAALLGDTISFTATLEDGLGSMAIATAQLLVRATNAPAVALGARTDSGLADLADAPTVDSVVAASADLGGTVSTGTAFTLLIDVTPGDGRVDAHTDPELMLATPPQDGLARGGGNEVRVQLTCDQQLGPASNLPATGAPPYDALPAYDGSNERAIVDAAIAAGVDPTTIALPAGFDLSVLLNRNILTTDASGVPSPDSRIPSTIFTLGYGVPAIQAFDAGLSGATATFTVVVTDEIDQASMSQVVLTIP